MYIGNIFLNCSGTNDKWIPCENITLYHVNFEIPYNCAYTPPAPTKYTIVSVAPVIILHSNTCTYFGKKLRWLVETFVDGEHIIRDEKFNEKDVRAKIIIGKKIYYIDVNGVMFENGSSLLLDNSTFNELKALFYQYTGTCDQTTSDNKSSNMTNCR